MIGELYTLSEAARVLRCCRRTVERHVEAGRIPARDVGVERRRLLIAGDDLARFLSGGASAGVDKIGQPTVRGPRNARSRDVRGRFAAAPATSTEETETT